MFDMLVAGGPLMIPIVLASFVMLLIVFERLICLRRRRVVPRLFIERFLLQLREGALDRGEALDRCDEDSSHIARVFAAAVRKWGKPAVEVEQAVLDEGERIANVLRRYLRVLNGVSTVSPLLGLLGTVWGMIQAFNVIATSPAMGRAEMLAGGISVALITTAAGLLVAIPALIFYLYFVGRVDSLVMEIDQHAQELVNLISFEALEERPTARIPMQRRKAA
jgi:biopolymer transport protein ExbB